MALSLLASDPIAVTPARTLRLEPVHTRRALRAFVTFPWTIYRGDAHWVPPLIGAQMDKLDASKNPFWRDAERELWIAYRGTEPVGTIAAIDDRGRNRALGTLTGAFGFFECVDDPGVARALIERASAWLRARGLERIEGPYNPGAADEPGVLVDGFDSRPALMEGHHPRYYAALLEAAGLEKAHDAYAWMVRNPGRAARDARELLSARVFANAARATKRGDVTTRPIDVARWDAEIGAAHRLYNDSLATVPGFVPIAEEPFRASAGDFRAFMDPSLARFVCVSGRPVGFALALPDVNEALVHANGRLFPLGLIKLMWHKRHLRRATFKILVIDPAFRHRGLESVLIAEVAQALVDGGYEEADLSLTGEENVKINVILAALGLAVYRTYRVFGAAL